jgi:hypothetical protein
MQEPAHQAASAGEPGAASACPGSAGPRCAGTGNAGMQGYASTSDALAVAQSALAFVASADAASLPVAELGDCLKALERAESAHTAARARILAAFNGRGGWELDGSRSAKSWLISHTRVTGGSAAGAMGWMRRLAAHPRTGTALAAGQVSGSWARQFCDWTSLLPPDVRDDADKILLAAAAGGAGLADLSGLAEEMYRRTAPPDDDGDDDGYKDRTFRLDVLYGGHGRPAGDLSPECTAALQAALASLGKKGGPEDTRTRGQRDHDALEEICRRAIAAGGMPDAAGQPTQVQLNVTLEQLRSLPGAAEAEQAWLAGRAAGDGQAGWLTGRAAAEAYTCDAAITPMVTGHIDPAALAAVTRAFLAARHQAPAGPCAFSGCSHPVVPRPAGHRGRPANVMTLSADTHSWQPHPRRPDQPQPGGTSPATPGPASTSGRAGPGDPAGPAGHTRADRADQAGTGPGRAVGPGLPPATLARLQDTLTRYAADVLSGPAGLAAFLRTGLLAGQFPPSASLPLDVGTAVSTVPPHLRRAVIRRDRHCAFPGCDARPVSCHAHHIIPRSQGGPTALTNLILMCAYHHLHVIHRQGWTITLHGDGTTTAVSPDGQQTLHSHGPPVPTAA